MRAQRARPRHLWQALILVLMTLLIIGLIGLSPLALGAFKGATSRWERLSFIGQTYGAASAILAVLALVGVVFTLVFQAHEAKTAREDARRVAIGDLLRMAMDDPDLDECWGPVPEEQDVRTRRQQMYVNMILSQWQMSFETRALGERRLRAVSSEMFHGRVGREFWATARSVRLSTSETRRARRFHQILDEEYQRAPEPADEPAAPRRNSAAEATSAGVIAGLTVIGAVIAHRMIVRGRGRRS